MCFNWGLVSFEAGVHLGRIAWVASDIVFVPSAQSIFLHPNSHKYEGNYPGLQDLFEKYHDQGLEVLAFPSNQVRLLYRVSGWNAAA